MFEQVLPNASQRRHWRTNKVGLFVQAPFVADSVRPCVVVPLITGSAVFDGGGGKNSATPCVDKGPTVAKEPPMTSRGPDTASAFTSSLAFGSQVASAAPVPVVASFAMWLRDWPPIELAPLKLPPA